MKYSSLLSLLMGLLSIASAAPRDDMAANAQLRTEAIRLFNEQNPGAAVAALQARVRSGARGGDKEIEVAQQLADLAFHFDARDREKLAHQAAEAALDAAAPLLRRQNLNHYQAGLLGNIGLVAERVLRDLDTAEIYYAAALAADPANQQVKQRLGIATEKKRRRAEKK